MSSVGGGASTSARGARAGPATNVGPSDPGGAPGTSAGPPPDRATAGPRSTTFDGVKLAEQVPVMRARADYDPIEDDELLLVTGDLVTIFEVFPDYWARAGLNGDTGMVPLTYMEKCAEQIVVAIHAFEADREDEIELAAGQNVLVFEEYDDGWGCGMRLDGQNKVGAFPISYVVDIKHDLYTIPSEAVAALEEDAAAADDNPLHDFSVNWQRLESELDEDNQVGFMDRVHELWNQFDDDNSGTLDFSEVTRLLTGLNLKFKRKILKLKFAAVDDDGNGELDFEEFIAFYHLLAAREEMNAVFYDYSNRSPTLDPRQLRTFILVEQKEDMSLEAVADLMPRFEAHDDGVYWTVHGFRAFLASSFNAVMDPEKERTVYQEMTHPLTDYWIDSSHNTYCTGDQLRGASSVDQYKFALLLGCRCVELDCWDGPAGEPLIYHGRTLTSRIRFRDVVQAIHDYGFVVSPYPIILSLENHCSHDQQRVMAAVFDEILGDMVPPPFLDTGIERLPSPDELRHKVILKGKMIGREHFGGGDSSSDDSDDIDAEVDDGGDLSAFESETDEDNRDDNRPGLLRVVRRGKRRAAASASEVSARSRSGSRLRVDDSTKKKFKVCEELSEMTHLRTIHFKTFGAPRDPAEMSSFSENKINKLLSKKASQFLKYTSNYFARVYPKGTRFDSSNYDPMASWSLGAQMVALNYQTPDLSMFLNRGRFRLNGGCGYVLKPIGLRDGRKLRDPNTSRIKKRERTLTVNIISGWQLPKVNTQKETDIIDPYVVVSVSGVRKDVSKRFKTRTVSNNGFHPVWDETFTFPIRRPDHAILVIQVWDSEKIGSDDFIGYASVPVEALREGYRHVGLFDAEHVPLKGVSLFARFKLA